MTETKTDAAATSEGAAAADKAAADAKAAADKSAADAKAAANTAAADAAAKATADAGKTTETAGKEAGSTADATTSKAPDKYDLKVADADKVFADDTLLAHLEGIARAGNLSNEDAQAFVDEQVAVLRARSEAFLTEAKAHKTYGGEKFDETVRLAKTAIDKVFPVGHEMRPSFLRFLQQAGADHNINVLAFLSTVGKQMGEDSPTFTRSSGGSERSAEDLLYDHPSSKV
jgi:hypothetical protein